MYPRWRRLLLPLKARFELDRVILVADSGMLSKENIAVLRSMGHDYVVAARLRSMKAEELRKISDTLVWKETGNGRRVTEVSIGGRRLVLRYCPKRAAKDAHERERAVEKAKKRLASGVKGTDRSNRFLKVRRDAIELNQEAIDKDRRLEGLHGVWTSLTETSGPDVYAQYGALWQIEEGFRVLKHTMAIRPVFPLDRAPGAGSHCDLFCCFCDATHLAPTLQHAAWRGNASERRTNLGTVKGSRGVAGARSEHAASLCDSLRSQPHQDPTLQGIRVDDPATDGTGRIRRVSREVDSGRERLY